MEIAVGNMFQFPSICREENRSLYVIRALLDIYRFIFSENPY